MPEWNHHRSHRRIMITKKKNTKKKKRERGKQLYMSMVHLEPPVLHPAVAIDGEGLDGELSPDLVGLVLRLALVVG